jgi:hypothetical protein
MLFALGIFHLPLVALRFINFSSLYYGTGMNETTVPSIICQSRSGQSITEPTQVFFIQETPVQRVRQFQTEKTVPGTLAKKSEKLLINKKNKGKTPQ